MSMHLSQQDAALFCANLMQLGLTWEDLGSRKQLFMIRSKLVHLLRGRRDLAVIYMSMHCKYEGRMIQWYGQDFVTTNFIEAASKIGIHMPDGDGRLMLLAIDSDMGRR